MHTEIKHLAKLFTGVDDIREVIRQDCHFPDMEATSIDDIVHGFEAFFGVKIRFWVSPDLKDNLLRGIYLPYGNDIRIYIDRDLPENWLKYIQVKEMCNLILQDDDYKTTDPGNLIELMIFEESAPLDGDAPLDLVSDFWAKYAAHELLFPYASRDKARTDLAEGAHTLFSLAEHYGVPEHVIELCLSPKYHTLCTTAWSQTPVR